MSLSSKAARRTLPLLALLAFGGIAFSQVADDVEARIRRVERGLSAPIAERLRFYKVPGVSVAVIANGRVQWARGFGVTAEGGKPGDGETVFQAASISKPIAAMIAMRLVEMGKLSLEEYVNLKLRSWK